METISFKLHYVLTGDTLIKKGKDFSTAYGNFNYTDENGVVWQVPLWALSSIEFDEPAFIEFGL